MTKKATTPPTAPEVETPEVETPETEAQSIVFERSHPDFAYWPGDKATLSPEHTAKLVNGGFARFDDAETAEAPTDETR